MKKKLAALLMSAALVVPASAIVLNGCGGNDNSGGGSQQEQQQTISYVEYQITNSAKFNVWISPTLRQDSLKSYYAAIEVRKGVDLQASDFDIKTLVHTDGGAEYYASDVQVDTEAMSWGETQWQAQDDMQSVWIDGFEIKYNHRITYSFEDYSFDLYVRVLPQVIDLTSFNLHDEEATTFSYTDVLASTTQDEGGKYIDIINVLDAEQPIDTLKLSYLEAQGLITIGRGVQGTVDPLYPEYTYDDATYNSATERSYCVTRAYHSNSGDGMRYVYTITPADGYSIKYNDAGGQPIEVEGENWFDWRIDYIHIDPANYQTSNTNLTFDINHTQHPTVTFNSDVALPADLITYDGAHYWVGSYNSLGVYILEKYARDYKFVYENYVSNNADLTQEDSWWSISPIVLEASEVAFTNPLQGYTYNGSEITPAITYSNISAIADIFTVAYEDNVGAGNNTAKAKLVFMSNFVLNVDGQNYNADSLNPQFIGNSNGSVWGAFVWDNAPQDVTTYQDLVLTFSIAKADATHSTNDLRVSMTFNPNLDQNGFANLVGTLGYSQSGVLAWHPDSWSNLNDNNEAGWEMDKHVYELKEGQSIDLHGGNRTFVAKYYPDLDNYNPTEVTISLTVNKAEFSVFDITFVSDGTFTNSAARWTTYNAQPHVYKARITFDDDKTSVLVDSNTTTTQQCGLADVNINFAVYYSYSTASSIGNNAINAGSYISGITLTHNDYILMYGGIELTEVIHTSDTWTIGKAEMSLLDSTSTTIFMDNYVDGTVKQHPTSYANNAGRELAVLNTIDDILELPANAITVGSESTALVTGLTVNYYKWIPIDEFSGEWTLLSGAPNLPGDYKAVVLPVQADDNYDVFVYRANDLENRTNLTAGEYEKYFTIYPNIIDLTDVAWSIGSNQHIQYYVGTAPHLTNIPQGAFVEYTYQYYDESLPAGSKWVDTTSREYLLNGESTKMHVQATVSINNTLYGASGVKFQCNQEDVEVPYLFDWHTYYVDKCVVTEDNFVLSAIAQDEGHYVAYQMVRLSDGTSMGGVVDVSFAIYKDDDLVNPVCTGTTNGYNIVTINGDCVGEGTYTIVATVSAASSDYYELHDNNGATVPQLEITTVYTSDESIFN